jgi:hypothetical protein
MKFQPGNEYHKLRKTRAGGGRKPSPVKAELNALARDKQNVSKYLKHMSDIALYSEDAKLAIQACIYLIDRHLGKATQVQDVSVTPRPFTQDDIELMAQVKIAEERLLAQYQDETLEEYSEENGHKNLPEAQEFDA